MGPFSTQSFIRFCGWIGLIFLYSSHEDQLVLCMEKCRMWLFASTPFMRLCRFHRIWILGSLGSSLPIQRELLVCSVGATALLCSSLKVLDQSLRYKTTLLLDLGNKKARLWLKGLLAPLPEVIWAMVHQGSWLLRRDLFAMCLDHTGKMLLAGTAVNLPVSCLCCGLLADRSQPPGLETDK